jgi:hypothetical protein
MYYYIYILSYLLKFYHSTYYLYLHLTIYFLPNLYYTYKEDGYIDPLIHIAKGYDVKDKSQMVPGFTTSSKDLILFIYNKIKNYIIVKKYQFNLLMQIFDEYKKGLIKNNDKIKELSYEMKENKHQDIDYEIDLVKQNIISCIEKNIELDMKNEIIKMEKKEDLKIILSHKKTGLNNPNYGKHLNPNHSLNISIETTKSKRANNPNLTDEKIREIYELQGKIPQKDVAEKYNMNREMIRRIWAKIILPLDSNEFIENKQENISNKINKIPSNITCAQKTSIGKRSLNIDEYIEILQWKIKSNNNEKLDNKKIFSTNLSEYLSKLWNKKVTNDMIKNIWCGKTKLFDFEFDGKEITYEKYMEVIS